MKKLIGLVFLMLILISASEISTSEPNTMHTMEGTWELESFYFYANNVVTDTVPIQDGYRQMKMYYDGKIMWSRTDPRDTIGRFGFGSYVITETELIDTIRNFTFELQLTDSHYSQISADDEGNRTFSENYKRIN